MSFRLKTVLGIASIEALLLTILVISGLSYLSSSNAALLQQRAATTAKLVATMTGDAVIAVDLATLDVLVDQTLRNPDLRYLRIRSADGGVLSAGGDADALAAPFVEDETIEQASNDGRLDVSAPITVAGSTFGHVELGLSTEKLDSIFGDALVWMVGIALLEMILVALLGLALGYYLTRQLTQLKQGAGRVASGCFGYQIPIHGRDELAETAQSFNSMSMALARYAELAEDARRRAEAGRDLAETTLKDALDSMRDYVLVVGDDGRVVLANQTYRALYCADVVPSDADAAFATEAARNHASVDDYVESRRQKLASPSDRSRWEAVLTDGRRLLISQHPMSKGGVVVVQTDVSDLYQALEENRQLQNELIQRQKYQAIGTLAGGLAHEINTPVQVIADNGSFLAETTDEIFRLIDRLSDSPELSRRVLMQALEAADWAYVRDEIPKALADMTSGTERVRDLISTFKQFAKPEGAAIGLVDLRDAVGSAIESTRHVWEPIAEIRTRFSDRLPPVPCQVDQIRQVLRHVIVNAAHAIDDRGAGEPGWIDISLVEDREWAVLKIEDNGCGIPPEHLHRIYDVLFTTKEPGRGSGQGLALAHMFVTQLHGGHIGVQSTQGSGACFTIKLPFADGRPAEAGSLTTPPSSTGPKWQSVLDEASLGIIDRSLPAIPH